MFYDYQLKDIESMLQNEGVGIYMKVNVLCLISILFRLKVYKCAYAFIGETPNKDYCAFLSINSKHNYNIKFYFFPEKFAIMDYRMLNIRGHHTEFIDALYRLFANELENTTE